MEKEFEPKVTTDKIEFKEYAIKAALENLSKKISLTGEEKEKILKLYLKDNRDLNVIFEEISKLTIEDLNKKLNKVFNEEKKVENKISLDLIDEFRNEANTKNLIKIHYPYPSEKIKIIENHSGLTAKELFEKSKDEDGLVTMNGFVNSFDVSRNYIEPDRIEIKLYNVTELAKKGEYNKLSLKEKECVLGLIYCIINKLAKNEEHKEELRRTPVDKIIIMLNKNVFIAPDENIIVLSSMDDPTKDEIKAVTKNANNEYMLRDLKLGDKEIVKDSDMSDPTPSREEKAKEEKGKPLIKKRPSYWSSNKNKAA